MVPVLWHSSGVRFGYAYNVGETGIVKEADLPRLLAVKAVTVIEQPARVPDKYQAPESAHHQARKYERRKK